MEFSADQFQYTVLGINFVVTAILIAYSIYLYKIERDLRKKFNSINTKASNIIEDANKKAIDIINHSKYLSESLKESAEHSFESVIKDLKHENKNFYKSLEQAYFDKSEQFIKEIQQSEEKDIKQFSENIAKSTTETKSAIEKRIEAEYAEVHKDIDKFKEMKKKEFENKLKEKVGAISVSILPQYLKVEDQEKFAKEVIEKAASEGFFN